MSYWESISQSDDWLTPKYVFDALQETFDLDVAGHPAAAVPCVEMYTEGGLCLPWHGFVWCNPPYGARNGVLPWLHKFIEHNNGVALVADRTSAPWFQEAAARMDALLFLSPKVQFLRPDGSRGGAPSNGSVLMARGCRAVAALVRARNQGLLVKVYND